jgi:hypothetical protein
VTAWTGFYCNKHEMPNKKHSKKPDAIQLK